MKFIKSKKIKLMLLAVLVATLGVFGAFSMQAKAEVTAPTSFTANNEKLLDGYIDNWHYGKLTNSAGGYVYCQDFHKQIPYGVTMTLSGEAPAGIAYIIANGFPYKSITGDDDMDYYITQAAVWWYLDETAGTNNLPDNFKTTGSDPHNIRQYIIKLVNEAKNVTGYATPAISLVNNNSNLHLSSDKKYYESDAIGVKTLYTTGNYTVSLSNAPEGTTVVNANSNAVTNSFSPSESFKIRVPVSSVDPGNLSIKITATTTGSINKAYKYDSSDEAKQDVIGSVLYPETSTVKAETTVNLSTSKVTITKIDADTNKPLAGAVFVVKDSSGKEVATWTSTTNSYVIRNLPNGDYTLQETKAPAGYNLNTQIVKFTISDTNRNIVIRFQNREIEKKATIIKVDADTNKAVAGATLVVKDESGKEVANFVTTTSPYVLEDLADGTYTVEETKAPAGYEKTDEIYKFTISDTNNNIKVTIKNKAIDKKATIIKVDADTNQPVAGATLVVKDESGKEVANFVTTLKPYVLEDLADGTYTVEELKAPAGYEKTDEIYNFTISDTNNNVTVTIENKAIEKLVNILKVDAKTGDPLKGATLVVKNSDGEVIEEFVTTEEAHTITGLKDGKYTVEETKAPEGYKKSDEIYEFTISDETPTAVIMFENYEEVEVPFTGSSKSLISTLFGTMLIISGVGFVYYNGKNQKVK